MGMGVFFDIFFNSKSDLLDIVLLILHATLFVLI